MSFVQYGMANLNELSTELLLAYLHDAALPGVLAEFREELDCTEYGVTQTSILLSQCVAVISASSIHGGDRVGKKRQCQVEE